MADDESNSTDSLRVLIADDEPRDELLLLALSDSGNGVYCRAVTRVGDLEEALRNEKWDACLVNEEAANCGSYAVATLLSELNLNLPKVLFRMENDRIRPVRVMRAWSRHLFGELHSDNHSAQFGQRLKTLVRDFTSGDVAGFKSFLSHLVGVACIKEAGGTILYINEYAKNWFKRPPSEIIGHTDMELWPEELAREIVAEDRKVVELGEARERVEKYLIDGDDRIFLTVRFPLHNPSRNLVGSLSVEITKRVRAEEMLKRATDELREKHEELENKSIALREVLRETERERDDVERTVAENLESAVLPIIERLERMAGRDLQDVISELKTELNQIASPFISRIKSEFSELSPREVEVCRMIRRGLSSKEIGNNLNLSPSTIYKYRELIRKKLGLTNEGVALKTYLYSREDLG